LLLGFLEGRQGARRFRKTRFTDFFNDGCFWGLGFYLFFLFCSFCNSKRHLKNRIDEFIETPAKETKMAIDKVRKNAHKAVSSMVGVLNFKNNYYEYIL